MSPSKSRLGRGLDALIPVGDEDTSASLGVVQIEVDDIVPNPHQPRSAFRDQDLVELAASIQEHGIIQPLIVTRLGSSYQLIAGERRWRAARLAELSTVPALVKDVAPIEMLELALVENVQRADLNALEEAFAYRQLTEEFGLTQDQVARRVGKSRVAVSNVLRLLKAAPAVQEALLTDRISEGHARAILGLEHDEAQEAALATVVKQGLNVRQTEALIRRIQGQRPKPRHRAEDEASNRALEAIFRETLSTRVDVKRSGAGGRVVIYFYSEEELDTLYQRVVGDATDHPVG
ncbi:MAG: ParB/RepB/Spo0J family partition protein [Chloroflexi bacterium]|nr:ParB/RepB/Spo0J family partition protein [Chloroflexota bacterium]